jgi:hypothetical protein
MLDRSTKAHGWRHLTGLAVGEYRLQLPSDREVQIMSRQATPTGSHKPLQLVWFYSPRHGYWAKFVRWGWTIASFALRGRGVRGDVGALGRS